jgi:multiple sugar transport system substrate-binding protein
MFAMVEKTEESRSSPLQSVMSRRHFLKVAAAATGATLLNACAPAATPEPTEAPAPVTIEWWVAEWNDAIRNWIQEEFVPEFEKDNPGIKVNPTFVDWGDYLTKLTTAFAGGTAPDLSAGGSAMVGTIADKNQGTVINDLVDRLSSSTRATSTVFPPTSASSR